MAKHRSYSIEFERQVAQEYLGGETLHGLAKRHDISRDLIRIWVAKYEAGSFDSDVAVANIVQARGGAHRHAGAPRRQAGSGERVSKGASRDAARRRSACLSSREVISPPAIEKGAVRT
jgi:transposase